MNTDALISELRELRARIDITLERLVTTKVERPKKDRKTKYKIKIRK